MSNFSFIFIPMHKSSKYVCYICLLKNIKGKIYIYIYIYIYDFVMFHLLWKDKGKSNITKISFKIFNFYIKNKNK